jgi:cytochrome P450
MSPEVGYMVEEIMVSHPRFSTEGLFANRQYFKQVKDLNMVKNAIADFKSGIKPTRPTIFNSLLESSLPDKEKAVSRLHGEAFLLLGAGAETTSWTLTVGTFHLLDKPERLQLLIKELQTVVVDPQNLPPWRVLEELPYLTGVIKESIRLSYGVSLRTMRVAPTEDLVYKGKGRNEGWEYVVPRGYAIGMSNRLMHIDEQLFPDPETYEPMRWVIEGERNRVLEAWFQPFGRGTRRCLGIKYVFFVLFLIFIFSLSLFARIFDVQRNVANQFHSSLAYCELYCAFAALALRVFPHIALYKTMVEDVRYHHDEFNPKPVLTSKGVRAVVLEQAED